jgi:phosphoribosylamine--glycine ligase
MSGASILVVGAGGREHAITWACAEQCASITVAPGNGGTVGSIGACKLEQSPATTVPEIVALAQQLKPELVIVGPEVPLADGLAGACSEGRGGRREVGRRKRANFLVECSAAPAAQAFPRGARDAGRLWLITRERPCAEDPCRAERGSRLRPLRPESARGPLKFPCPPHPPPLPCADALADKGIPCFGPRKLAARLESSKAYSKDFMSRHRIPTAAYANFTDAAAAEAYIRSRPHRVVVKASGLAAGKGVFVPATADEAVAAVRSVMVDRVFGEAGAEVVVEEFLEGVEVSVLAFSDGTTVVPMPGAQDHKRIFEFDEGPNTGGMGAFAPSPILDAALLRSVVETALQPVVDGLRAEGCPYVGVLYAGLMVRPDRSFAVLEYNCRLGDPETQVLLPLLETPLLDVVRACVRGELKSIDVKFKRNVVAATVVAVAGGYPDAYDKGKPVAFGAGASASACALRPADRSGSFIFHAGTRRADGGAVVTNGGRVLAVTSLAPSLAAATKASYRVLEDVAFDGMFFRRDIGGRCVRPRAHAQPLRVAVLGSTRGSNLVPILAAIADGDLRGAEVSVIISNKADAGILEKAAAAGIKSHVVPSAGRSREVCVETSRAPRDPGPPFASQSHESSPPLQSPPPPPLSPLSPRTHAGL